MAIRDEAGLHAGTELEIELRDGRIEIEPARVPMRVVNRAGRVTIEADADLPSLTDDDVRDVLERTRR